MRQRDGAADVLIGLTSVDAQTEVSLDGLVELGAGELLDELHSLKRGVEGSAVNLGRSLTELLAMLISHVNTSCGAIGDEPLPHQSCARMAHELPKETEEVTRRW